MFFSATLGGNFGLFLGGSFLSILQILEYIFDEVTATCMCKSCSPNHVSASRAKPEDEKADVGDAISIIDIRKDPKECWNENFKKR